MGLSFRNRRTLFTSFHAGVAMLCNLALCALVVFGAVTTPAYAGTKRIALTFDDVPRGRGAWFTPDDRTRRIISALRAARVRQAAFFVVPGQIGRDDGAGGETRIAAYVRAGHVIANHSFSHRPLTEVGAEAYLADIDQAHAWLSIQQGFRPWFRFPFLNEGRADKAKRDAVRAGLTTRKLTNGYVTIDANDWQMESMTADAVKAGVRIDRAALRTLYVETHVGAANFFDGLAIKAIGRSPAHVLLLHETDLAALYVDDLVRALRRDGWEIITADQAFADPIAAEAATIDVPSAQGTLTEALAWRQRLPAPRWYDRNSMDVLKGLFDQQVLKRAASQKERTAS